MTKATLRFLAAATLALTGCADNNNDIVPSALSFQQFYTPLAVSLDIKTLESAERGTLYYIDEGDPEGIPVLLITGSGTSTTAALLTSHLDGLRDQLGIRLVSVQRNGLGPSAHDADWGYADYVADVMAVLTHLGIEQFHVFAISGGGPYTSYLAAALGERINSLHLAATITGNNELNGETTRVGTIGTVCTLAGDETPLANIKTLLASFALPSAEIWWGFADDNPMLAVEGFEAAAAVDWEYTFFTRDPDEALTGAAAEIWRYCTVPIADLENFTAPAYIYHGTEDTSAPEINVLVWQASLANAQMVTTRVYPDEGHWVQYSHLEQIYTDIALPGNLVICNAGATRILPAAKAQAQLDSGDARLGMCTE